MIALEPCPFCRGDGKVFSIGWMTYCQCQDPKCAALVSVNGKDNFQAVMAKWNRRA